MGIRAASHIAIGVSSMDAALHFYRDLLGLRVALDREERSVDRSGAHPLERRRRAVYLRWADGPDATFLVLDEQLDHERRGQAKPMFDIGVHHVAFWVDDLDAVVNSLTAAGHPPFTGPVELDTPYYGEQPGGRVRTALLRDPDGNVVQFDQRV